MADSGGTEGTPVQPGSPVGLDIAQPLKYTLLSRPYYARLMGINPVLFQGATAESIGVWPLTNNRNNDLWPRHSWQDADRISHEDLAIAIYNAEQEIMQYLKYPLAPTWIYQDIKMYPVHHRPDVWQSSMANVRGALKSVILDYGKIISPGQRNTTLVGTATTTGGSLAYTDEDGDGFAETATVTLSTSLTDACEIKVYFSDTEGIQEWEIRPANTKSITGGIFTATFSSWLFINPDLRSTYPSTANFGAVDIGTITNYVDSVDVYREYNDPSLASSTLFWEPNPSWMNGLCGICGSSGCTSCQLTTQDGCFHIRNAELGEVVPVAATYDETSSSWQRSSLSVCRDPDIVRLSYYAGNLSNENLGGRTCEGLSNYWALTIAMLATARLERPMCSGTNVIALTRKWQIDLAFSGDTSFNISPGDLENPFGTKGGEVMAWRRLKHLSKRRMTGVAI